MSTLPKSHFSSMRPHHLLLRLTLSLLLALVSLVTMADAPSDEAAILAGGWKPARHTENLHTYLRQDPGQRLKSFRIEADVRTSAPALGAIFTDFDHYCDWIYRCGEARVLKRISDTEYLIYIIHRAPYGVSDRDTIIHGKAYRDPAHHAVIIKTWEERYALPEQPHLVRMIHEELEWTFTAKPDGIIHIQLLGYADPGGWIPRWIDNMVQLDAPYYSVRGLMHHVNRPEYVDAKLPSDVMQLWQDLVDDAHTLPSDTKANEP